MLVQNQFPLYSWVGMSSSKATFVCLHAIDVVFFVMHSKIKLINLPLSCFSPQLLTNWYVSIKLANHPYFTRSKVSADSFLDQSSNKGRAVMGDNNKEIGLTDVVVTQPTIAIRMNYYAANAAHC